MRTEVAEGTMAFALEQPPGFEFKAGQYVIMVLPNPPHTDAEGNRRVFSIASPPQDTQRLVITTRMTGTAFKRSLAEVPLGTPVDLSGPRGPSASLRMPPSRWCSSRARWIAPFRSILHDVRDRRRRIGSPSSTQVVRRPGRPARSLHLAQTTRDLAYVPTMTQVNPADVGRGRRKVTADFCAATSRRSPRRDVLPGGPPGLVAGVTKALNDAGADPTPSLLRGIRGYYAVDIEQLSGEISGTA